MEKIIEYKTPKAIRKQILRLAARLLEGSLTPSERQELHDTIAHLRALIKTVKRIENLRPRQLFRRFKADARRNGIEWALEFADVECFIGAPCSTCGHVATENEPSIVIQRIDKSKGYIKGNIRQSCVKCNNKKIITE